MTKTNKVSVRWLDGYFEEFDAVEIRAGWAHLWILLADGLERQIPLVSVRWFGRAEPSRQKASESAANNRCLNEKKPAESA